MLQNVCSPTERVVRVIIGLAILSLVYFLQDQGAVRFWGLLGILPIGTAVFKYCPFSHLLGINTCTMKHT